MGVGVSKQLLMSTMRALIFFWDNTYTRFHFKAQAPKLAIKAHKTKNLQSTESIAINIYNSNNLFIHLYCTLSIKMYTSTIRSTTFLCLASFSPYRFLCLVLKQKQVTSQNYICCDYIYMHTYTGLLYNAISEVWATQWQRTFSSSIFFWSAV